MATDNQTVKSKKDTFRERFGTKHPDMNMDDEESFYGGISDDYDNYDSEIANRDEAINTYKKNEEDVVNAVTANQNNAELFRGMMNGDNVAVSMIRLFGDDFRTYLDNPENVDAIEKATEEYKAKIQKDEELRAEAEKNAAETDTMLRELVESGEFTQEQVDSAIDNLFDIADGLVVNVIKPEWIRAVIKANNHDADVENARKEGEVEGRNANIEKKMRESSTEDNGRVEMPVGVGGRAQTAERKKKGGSLTDQLFG